MLRCGWPSVVARNEKEPRSGLIFFRDGVSACNKAATQDQRAITRTISRTLFE